MKEMYEDQEFLKLENGSGCSLIQPNSIAGGCVDAMKDASTDLGTIGTGATFAAFAAIGSKHPVGAVIKTIIGETGAACLYGGIKAAEANYNETCKLSNKVEAALPLALAQQPAQQTEEEFWNNEITKQKELFDLDAMMDICSQKEKIEEKILAIMDDRPWPLSTEEKLRIDILQKESYRLEAIRQIMCKETDKSQEQIEQELWAKHELYELSHPKIEIKAKIWVINKIYKKFGILSPAESSELNKLQDELTIIENREIYLKSNVLKINEQHLNLDVSDIELQEALKSAKKYGVNLDDSEMLPGEITDLYSDDI